MWIYLKNNWVLCILNMSGSRGSSCISNTLCAPRAFLFRLHVCSCLNIFCNRCMQFWQSKKWNIRNASRALIVWWGLLHVETAIVQYSIQQRASSLSPSLSGIITFPSCSLLWYVQVSTVSIVSCKTLMERIGLVYLMRSCFLRPVQVCVFSVIIRTTNIRHGEFEVSTAVKV
jgi:hypothetical protein